MEPLESLHQVYEQVAREFQAEADVLVRREASRQRILELFAPVQTRAGWTDDRVFDAIVNERKASRLRKLHDLLANPN